MLLLQHLVDTRPNTWRAYFPKLQRQVQWLVRNEAECGDTLINENRFLAFMKSERRGEISQEGEHLALTTIPIPAVGSHPSLHDSGLTCKPVIVVA